MKNIGEIAKAFRGARGWNTSQMAAEVSKRQPPGRPVVKRQHIEQLEATGERVPRYIVALAKLLGTTTDALLLGDEPVQVGINQPSAIDGDAAGRAAVSAAVNVLVLCLQKMDEESRKEASYLLQKMAETPVGRWSGRLTDLIEKESAPDFWEAVGIYVRAGNYPLSSQNDPPRMKPKGGGAQTKAIDYSNRPTGPDDASAGEDRDEDEKGSGNGAAGSG